MGVKKLLLKGKAKLGGIGPLQRALVREGVEITTEAIRKAIEEDRGDRQRRLYKALNKLLNDGDWRKTGKDIDDDD